MKRSLLVTPFRIVSWYCIRPGRCYPILEGEPEVTVDQVINDSMTPVTRVLGADNILFTVPIGGMDVPFVLIWLIAGAIFFTFYNKFVNITAFKHAIGCGSWQVR